MKNVLVLGIGGSGNNVVRLYSQFKKKFQTSYFLAIDSDIQAVEKNGEIPSLCLTEYISLGNVVEKLGKDNVGEWFPCDDSQNKVAFYKSLDMGYGANGWRMKGLLSFEYMLSDSDKRNVFLTALDKLVDKESDDVPEIVIVSSLCGGTGSALFIPIALYIKRYLSSFHKKNANIRVLLSCPEVYANSLTAENRVKAYANAYAALTELNAVDLVSKGYNAEAKEKNKCKVTFKIGSKKSKGIGMLFDADAKEFATPSAFPFKTVYLFDRIPGLMNVPAHETAMAKVLDVLLSDNDCGNYLNVYAGISVAEIVFPCENISEYVAKRKNFDDINGEWSFIYKEMDQEFAADTDELVSFAKNFTGAYKRLFGQSGYDQYLALGREKEDDLLVADLKTCPKMASDFVEKYFKKLSDNFSLILSEINGEITAEIKSNDNDVLRSSLFDGKKRKQIKAEKVRSKAVKYCDLLLSYYKNIKEICNEKTGKITDVLLNESGACSLLNNFITKDGDYLHPVITTLLLSDLYVYLKGYVTAFREIPKGFFSDVEADELPDYLLINADKPYSEYEEYRRLGELRLKAVAEMSADAFSSKLINAFPDIKNDFIAISDELFRLFMRFALEQAISTVGDLLRKYSTLLEKVPSLINDHRVDLKVARIVNTVDSCTRMNVGVKEENKEKAYNIYVKLTENDFSRDSATGRIIYEYVTGKTENYYDELVREEKLRVEKCDAISKACDSDILRVLHDGDIFKSQTDLDKGTASHDLKRALGFAALPLDIAEYGDVKKGKPTSIAVSYFPIESAEFAKSLVGGSTLKDSLEQYLYRFGSFETGIEISDTIPKNQIVTVKKIYDFELYRFNKINEADVNCEYYKDFIKALSVKKEQSTEMWNPRLIKETKGDFIPFISPVVQDKFEKAVYKSTIYMLYKGLFVTSEDESKQQIFCYLDGEKREEATFEKERISVKTPERLFGFLRENATLSINYGKAFDDDIDKLKSKLPVIGFEKTDIPKFVDAICNAAIIRFFTDDILKGVRSIGVIKAKNCVDFIYEMSNSSAYKYEAENFCGIISDIIKGLINSRRFADDETYSLIFDAVIIDMKEDYLARSKKLGHKGYKEKAERVFGLIK